MSELLIKAESLASRCEICHQSDCFDAVKNYCTRCSHPTLPEKDKLPGDFKMIFVFAFIYLGIIAAFIYIVLSFITR
jgi:uncharacterized protein (DUF983 family)